jgi:uncharacterized protein
VKLFTKEEDKKLTALLARAADPEDTLTLDALHGFFFGLAIIPEPVMPSEWLPVVFGEQMLEIDSEDEAQTQLAPLFAVYNRIMGEKNRGKLTFPFDMGKLKENELEQIGEWTNGLYCAMRLRPDIWGLNRAEEEITSEEEEILSSCGVIMGIAMPEEIPNIFESERKMTEEDEAKRMALLFAMLPTAVRNIQEYADKGFLELPEDDEDRHPAELLRSEKIGRNDPCPCGSGKKFKKCCGAN